MAKKRLFKAFVPTKDKFVEVEAISLNQAREMCPAGQNWEEMENYGNPSRKFKCPFCKHVTRSPCHRLMINCKNCGRSMECNVFNEVFD